ncbi:hypothetical protein BDZ89DRAFT_1075451 [Hymenopellis radicata]|nr:hypothetical protein BDZ89DRAFT_1075451 [Hymenopellis radicata]
MHVDLTDLKLHSPSEIIGTPFDVDPRFEYPFPEPSSSGSDQLPTLPSLTTSLSASSISSASSSASSAPLNPSFPLYLFLPILSPTRTKVRIDTDSVPVPPSVAEKRRRRSLGLARKVSDGDEASGMPPRPPSDNVDPNQMARRQQLAETGTPHANL